MSLYLLPIEISGSWRGPKYFNWRFDPDPPSLIQSDWALCDYGFEPWALLTANLTASDDTTLRGQSDVSKIPDDWDSNLKSGQVNATKTVLESMNIPADWLNTTYTWRQMLRIVLGMFQYNQHYAALGGQNLFQTGVSLSTTFNSLPAGVRARLIQCANDLNYDTSGLTGTLTLRQILKNLGDQWGDAPVYIGPVTI